MLKVWIAGANGQIGRALNDVLDPMHIESLNTDLDELDITETCIPCQRTGSKKLKHRGKKMRGKDRPAFHR